ncbi:MAG: hypothetical protein E7310_03720 [Clostridiales bacterium]|nr:hypothetical protein [Clostridiales bacterium]
MLKNKKIVFSLIVVVAITIWGVISIVTKGFDYSLEYSANTEMEIATGIKDIQTNAIKEIVDSILQNENSMVQVNDENVYIISKNISEEQQSEILSKINEKYSINATKEEITVNENMVIDYWDIVYRYISPIIIVTVIILIYFGIKYRKQNWIKVIGISLGTLIILELLAISIIAIVRIPLSIYTIPVLLGLYLLTILVLTYIFEKNK